MVTLPHHKFITHTNIRSNYASLPNSSNDQALWYLLEVYMDNYIALAIPTCKSHLDHVAMAVMTGIHNVFLTSTEDLSDPISLKKLT